MPGHRPEPPGQPQRRRLLLRLGALAGGVGALASAACAAPAPAASSAAPVRRLACDDFDALWSSFAGTFLQPDGRVLDPDTEARVSTSEGQSYALFFALVADDRPRFDRVLQWTRQNLCSGDFAARLPAWQWGRQRDGRWGVLDANAASDADLWLAWTLIEAARLWNAPALATDGRALLARIRAEEVAEVPGLGTMLLPGPQGFVSEDRLQWRFNPSYAPLHVLRGLASADPGGPWTALAEQSARTLAGMAPHGLAPDWATWSVQHSAPLRGRWTADTQQGDTGSYDAIRCYLWAGVAPTDDPLKPALLQGLAGMQRHTRAATLPERLATRAPASADPASVARGTAPPGFTAALQPYLTALGDCAGAQHLAERLAATCASGTRLRYYDHALALFSTGWLQQRWRCDRHGRLQRTSTPSTPRCPTP
jgi:endoglucanase